MGLKPQADLLLSYRWCHLPSTQTQSTRLLGQCKRNQAGGSRTGNCSPGSCGLCLRQLNQGKEELCYFPHGMFAFFLGGRNFLGVAASAPPPLLHIHAVHKGSNPSFEEELGHLLIESPLGLGTGSRKGVWPNDPATESQLLCSSNWGKRQSSFSLWD